ncbi:MAG: MFS transporter [Ideonella sp.]|nr:MFS transporter [Ideonella sp.]MCC7455588.1 MFS transporter [Nitrospira sp.]
MLKRLGWFYLSCLAAFTAGHMVNYGVIIYAQEVIRADLLSGVAFGLCFGPPLLLGWSAGALCDRLAPGRLIHAAQGCFVLAALLLWWADTALPTPAARVVPLVVAAALAGVGWSFVSPARMAALGQVARPEELKPASVLFNLLVMMGFGLGPLAIAVLRRGSGWPAVFLGAAALFGLASAALLAVRTRASGRVHDALGAEVREGLAAIGARPLLRQLILAAMAGYLAMGPMTVLLPKLAATTLGLSELQRGALLGTLALSLIGGGLLALLLQRRVAHGRTILVATMLAGAALAALGAVGAATSAVLLLTAVGLAGGLALSLIVAGIQAQAPDALRGRIVSVYTIISQVVPAASGVAAGALVQGFGVAVALAVCGGTLVAVTALNAWRMTALRQHGG